MQDIMKNCLDPLPERESRRSVVCMCDYCGREVLEGELIWHEPDDGALVHDECLTDFAKSRMYERIADETLLWDAE